MMPLNHPKKAIRKDGKSHDLNVNDKQLRTANLVEYIFDVITQPSIYGEIVYFLLCHESLNYSTGQLL